MAMSVVYTVVNGMILSENRGGVETEFVPDTLGSVWQTRDMNGNVTSTTEYWPYGEIQSQTGTNPSKFCFVGLLGYVTDMANMLYVRARFYRPATTRWQTVDPLWPREFAYGCSRFDPADYADPSGMNPKSCLDSLLDDLRRTKLSQKDLDKFMQCLAKCGINPSKPDKRKCLVDCAKSTIGGKATEALLAYACCTMYSRDKRKGGYIGDPCAAGTSQNQEACCDSKWCKCFYLSSAGLPEHRYCSAQACETDVTGEPGCDYYRMPGERGG